MPREQTHFQGRRFRVRPLPCSPGKTDTATQHGQEDRGSRWPEAGTARPGIRAFGPWPVPRPSAIIAFGDVKE